MSGPRHRNRASSSSWRIQASSPISADLMRRATRVGHPLLGSCTPFNLHGALACRGSEAGTPGGPKRTVQRNVSKTSRRRRVTESGRRVKGQDEHPNSPRSTATRVRDPRSLAAEQGLPPRRLDYRASARPGKPCPPLRSTHFGQDETLGEDARVQPRICLIFRFRACISRGRVIFTARCQAPPHVKSAATRIPSNSSPLAFAQQGLAGSGPMVSQPLQANSLRHAISLCPASGHGQTRPDLPYRHR